MLVSWLLPRRGPKGVDQVLASSQINPINSILRNYRRKPVNTGTTQERAPTTHTFWGKIGVVNLDLFLTTFFPRLPDCSSVFSRYQENTSFVASGRA
jgi:hypothetical protein